MGGLEEASSLSSSDAIPSTLVSLHTLMNASITTSIDVIRSPPDMVSWQQRKRCAWKAQSDRRSEVYYSMSQESILACEWLLAEIAACLWLDDLVAVACSSRVVQQFVERCWKQLLMSRGFATVVIARLLPKQAGQLELWSGQWWDVWQYRGQLGEDLVLFRHLRFGTAVLLNSRSNGWFDFQESADATPQIFYCNGSTNDEDASVRDVASYILFNVSGLASQIDLCRAASLPGEHPLLRMQCNPLSCWRWVLQEGMGLVVFHEIPSSYHWHKRLHFTATGFTAFSELSQSKASLYVDRGHLQCL